LGAAYLAGLAVGFWPDKAAIAALWRKDKEFVPSMNDDRRSALLENWRKAVARIKG
jgi:glycerol kinase